MKGKGSFNTFDLSYCAFFLRWWGPDMHILLKRHLCKTEHGKTQEVLKVNHEQISLLVSVTEEGCEFWHLDTNENICRSARVSHEAVYSVEQCLSETYCRALGGDHVLASFTLGIDICYWLLIYAQQKKYHFLSRKPETTTPLFPPLVNTAR